jgi:hypothetical protein
MQIVTGNNGEGIKWRETAYLNVRSAIAGHIKAGFSVEKAIERVRTESTVGKVIFDSIASEFRIKPEFHE